MSSQYQTEEWSVLKSIHPTICVSNENAILTLRVPIELGRDTPVRILLAQLDPGPTLSTTLSVLPPIHLRVALPVTYPSHAPPIIHSVHSTSAWLAPSTLTSIKDRMTAMWSPSDDSGVLYTWVEWLRTGDFLAEIGLLADDTHAIQISHSSPQLLLTALLAYVSSSKSDEFALVSHRCAICLSERKGVHCFALSCRHVFCRSCLLDMWALHVREGQVSRVGCPESKCGKSDGIREATEDEVRAILSECDLVRWKWLRKKRDLERDPTMIHCPMEFCQEPVPKPTSDTSTSTDEDEDDSGWARLRTCTTCGYSFCVLCKRTWHGPHTHCPLPPIANFIRDYLSAPFGSSKRIAIERRYGRNNVVKLVKQYEEEQKNKKWMDSSTMTCPGCQVRVEKSMGCNHMTCAKCETHFCYRCGAKIPAATPYKHFATPHTPCFSKLFDFDPDAEDE